MAVLHLRFIKRRGPTDALIVERWRLLAEGEVLALELEERPDAVTEREREASR